MRDLTGSAGKPSAEQITGVLYGCLESSSPFQYRHSKHFSFFLRRQAHGPLHFLPMGKVRSDPGRGPDHRSRRHRPLARSSAAVTGQLQTGGGGERATAHRSGPSHRFLKATAALSPHPPRLPRPPLLRLLSLQPAFTSGRPPPAPAGDLPGERHGAGRDGGEAVSEPRSPLGRAARRGGLIPLTQRQPHRPPRPGSPAAPPHSRHWLNLACPPRPRGHDPLRSCPGKRDTERRKNGSDKSAAAASSSRYPRRSQPPPSSRGRKRARGGWADPPPASPLASPHRSAQLPPLPAPRAQHSQSRPPCPVVLYAPAPHVTGGGASAARAAPPPPGAGRAVRVPGGAELCPHPSPRPRPCQPRGRVGAGGGDRSTRVGPVPWARRGLPREPAGGEAGPRVARFLRETSPHRARPAATALPKGGTSDAAATPGAARRSPPPQPQGLGARLWLSSPQPLLLPWAATEGRRAGGGNAKMLAGVRGGVAGRTASKEDRKRAGAMFQQRGKRGSLEVTSVLRTTVVRVRGNGEYRHYSSEQHSQKQPKRARVWALLGTKSDILWSTTPSHLFILPLLTLHYAFHLKPIAGTLFFCL